MPARNRPMPTQASLRARFDYDSETGILTYSEAHIRQSRLRGRGYRLKPGPVGCYNKGYLSVGIDGIMHRLHRLIWKMVTGEEPEQIDHENGIRDDNRWCNLRACTCSQNSMHRIHRKPGKSGVRNVRYRPQRRSPWEACVHSLGKTAYKCFRTLPEARAFVFRKRKELHGEFAIPEEAV